MNGYDASKLQGYNSFPGSGWRRYGRLVVNFHNHRVTSIFFNGEQLLDHPAPGALSLAPSSFEPVSGATMQRLADATTAEGLKAVRRGK